MLYCRYRYLFSLACFLLCAGCHPIKPTKQGEYIRPGLSQEWHALFDGAKQSIAESMTKKDKIPGLSIALVDRQGLIWTAGFGYTDYDLKTPVTPDTIFSIQSMSKSLTTTLVLLAVQDGLVDLDTPITEYLPDFTVKSCFEENPQAKMTLRHLLSHTAGFVHEAPVGNNFEYAASYEAHIQSISDTWLKFPVGANYSYSNIGIDLAAYIIQKRSGCFFAGYMKSKLFEPLDMSNSSVDMDFIRQHPNRAIGHTLHVEKTTLEIPMLGAAGVYTSARDMAKFVQFYLNWGQVKGHGVLNKKYIESMAPGFSPARGFIDTTPFPSAVDPNAIIRAYTLNTSGQGYGFRSASTWFPEYGLGLLVLTNYDNTGYHDRLEGLLIGTAIEIMGRQLIQRTNIVYPILEDYLADNPKRPEYKKPDPDTFTPYKQEWKKYTGTYMNIHDWNFHTYARVALALGYPESRLKAKVYKKNGYLEINGKRLDEYQLGVFFTKDGDCLDFGGPMPLWKGVRIKKK